MRDFTVDPIRESASIHAPIERCFALSTRVELVRETLGMNLVDSGVAGGITSGHIQADSRVVWRGWKFGLPTSHHTMITGFADPHPARLSELHAQAADQPVAWFQDSQEKGRFAFFQHDHYFRESLEPDPANPGCLQAVTTLEDEVRFTLPFGALGSLIAGAILAPHIRKLCRKRFARIQSLAEGDGWREWVDPTADSDSATSRSAPTPAR